MNLGDKEALEKLQAMIDDFRQSNPRGNGKIEIIIENGSPTCARLVHVVKRERLQYRT